MKKICSLLLALMLLLSLATPAFAASANQGSTIVVRNRSLFDFQVISEYTETDLFDNFKNVMPGDTRTETVTIRNEARGFDYIKVYLRAVAHDEDNGLTYSEPFEFEDGKDQAGIDGVRDETVATMTDFLSQLTMRVYEGRRLIYEASPDELDGLRRNVYLGSLEYRDSVNLRVELDVPLSLNNDYANRVGEVDWVFTVETYHESSDEPSDNPKTGDYIIMGAVTLMAVSGAALLIILFVSKRRKNRK